MDMAKVSPTLVLQRNQPGWRELQICCQDVFCGWVVKEALWWFCSHSATSSYIQLPFFGFSGYMGTCITECVRWGSAHFVKSHFWPFKVGSNHVPKTLQLLNILQSQVTWGVLINWVSFVDGCYCLFKKEQPPGNAQRPNAHHLPVQKSVARNACVTLAPGKQHQAGKPVAVVHSPSLAWNLKYNWVVFIHNQVLFHCSPKNDGFQK